jgi:hypothetical protein
MIGDDMPFHIQASCASCEFLYDMKYGAECPKCHSTSVAWARRIDAEEYARERNFLFGEMARQMVRKRLNDWMAEQHSPYRFSGDYPGRLSSPYALTKGDELDIAELNKIFALEDNRDATRLPKP